jgi:hypothetical protein
MKAEGSFAVEYYVASGRRTRNCFASCRVLRQFTLTRMGHRIEGSAERGLVRRRRNEGFE